MKQGQSPNLSPMNRPGKGKRVLAPFREGYDPKRPVTWDRREAFYCHRYRLPDEHYHKTHEELVKCDEENYDR